MHGGVPIFKVKANTHGSNHFDQILSMALVHGELDKLHFEGGVLGISFFDHFKILHFLEFWGKERIGNGNRMGMAHLI